MQNAGLGNPPVQDWGKTSPSHLRALAATDKDAPPQPTNASLKDAQLRRVPRNSMVLVIAPNDLPEPLTDLRGRVMRPADQLSFDSFELCHQPLFRRLAPDNEGPVALALPAIVREAQNVEVCGFPSPRRFRVSGL